MCGLIRLLYAKVLRGIYSLAERYFPIEGLWGGHTVAGRHTGVCMYAIP